jgi:hypothetical protein
VALNPRASQAQPQAPLGTATLTGVVTDAESGTPLPNVNVFIASSTLGTATDQEGRFRLTGVPLGAQRLVVSNVGFATQTRNLNLREARVYTFEFALETESIELEDVVVYAERDEKWLERFEKFKQEFIGQTPNAEETEILNPEVLSFKGGIGTLEAFAEEPLVIENRALGYRIEYVLEDFKRMPSRVRYNGEPRYEELEGTPEEQAQWAERRREAYLGSFRHMMLALLAGRTEGQGFKLYFRPAPGTPGDGFSSSPVIGGQRTPIDAPQEELLSAGEVPSERQMAFQGMVEVIYLGERETEAYQTWREQYGGARRGPKYQTSYFWIEGHDSLTVDYKGDIVEYPGAVVSGFYAFERMADDLPKDYRLQ